MKKLYYYIVITLLLVLPTNVLAYSDKIILGGETLGINVESNGILVIGFYKIDGKYNKGNPELEVGDLITKVNDKPIYKIEELTKAIEDTIKDDKVNISFMRDKKEYTTTLNLKNEDGIYKTGLYVKDSLTGIGTLTYIDPETLYFGALGHEIVESNTNTKLEIKKGTIFKSTITDIDKSEDGNPGSKNAKFFYKTKFGDIIKNTESGIYGDFTSNLPDKDLIPVANKDEVKIGPAYIYTVLNGEEIKEFKIDITKINANSKTKNIYFEINDEELLDKTGGIVQGMSGSPIMQNGKIIGAITHVIIDNVKTGYGIFITTMLEEGEKR
ncbi:MAG: SpoIVB peptidase [Bacilli bacterium]|nr:SpoIVB peptidase [Bacilli bacterium]